MPGITMMIKPVSSACNMRCRYCFYTDVAQNRQYASMGTMTFETAENIVRRAFRYADGPVTFAFQGGEPTLAGVAFYEHFVSLEKQYNTRHLPVQNALQTNGYDIPDELIALFAREHFLVGVSLDGSAQIHDKLRIDASGNGTFQRVQDSVSRLQAAGVAFNILCVVNEYVANRPDETFSALRQYRYIQYISCLDPFDGTQAPHSLTVDSYTRFLKESFDLYYHAWKNNTPVSIRNFDNYLSILLGGQPENCGMCGRCAQYYLIEADGSVYPCDFYVLDQWKMGNINRDSFFRLEKSPVSARFRDDSLHRDPKCIKCKWYPLCRGGCRRDREPFENENPVLNRWCDSYTALFEYAYPRMCEMAQEIAQNNAHREA